MARGLLINLGSHHNREVVLLNALVGQFLKSSEGGSLVQELKGKGLTEDQATHAVTATAEGAAQQAPGDAGGLGAVAGLLGGGGLGALLGGSVAAPAPAAPAGATPAPGALVQFVAQKTGLSPAMAQVVVSTVLPKVMAMLGQPAAAPGAAPAAAPAAPAGGDLLSAMGSLIR